MDELNKTFELEFEGRTYTTQKLTAPLRGKVLRTLAYIRAETEGKTEAEIQASESLQLAATGAMFEHMPGLIWDFLRPEDKTRIGTRDGFMELLDPEQITAFMQWVSDQLMAMNDFFESRRQPKAAPQPQPQPSGQPSAGGMAGMTPTSML